MNSEQNKVEWNCLGTIVSMIPLAILALFAYMLFSLAFLPVPVSEPKTALQIEAHEETVEMIREAQLEIEEDLRELRERE